MTRRKRSTRKSSGNSTSRNRRTSRSGSTRTSSRRSSRSQSSKPWFDLSATLRIEIVGIVFLSMAILTFLSFMSPSQGTITTRWLHLLRQGFGWGTYLMPVILGAAGMGLLMHGFGRLPQVRWEKVAGLLLIFLTMLGFTHLIVTGSASTDLSRAPQPTMRSGWPVVLEGQGGGLVGWVVGQGLVYTIGRLGAYVVTVALFFIGLVLFIGRSIAEIGMTVWLGWEWLRGQVQLWQSERAEELFPTEPEYTINSRATVAELESEAPRELPMAAPSPRPAARVIGEEPTAPSPPPSRLTSMRRAPQPKGGQAAWRLPDVRDVLEDLSDQELSQAEIQNRVQIIEETLESFGVPARVVEVNQGPVITQFGVEPGFVTGRGGKQTKVKVSRISALADDLSLALAASPIRIEAPVPGRSIVGIEVPNKEVALVSLRGVMATEAFERLAKKTPLPIALGENVSGEPIVTDLVGMPHLLIAGATGSGKSVCINAIIAGFLCTNTPQTLRMIMIDPKRVELTGYNGIPHLLFPVVVDLERVVGTLQWVTREMEQRYRRFAKVGARNIEDYNRRVVAGEQDRMPYVVVFIDELADLMMIAPDEVERSICRIAQMARATGIHLIIATQRPSVDVVTGLIKANFPARVSFMVTSSVDSRVIIDTVGAERLLGSGDMLFMSPDASQTVRLQGCFVSPPELDRVIGFWQRQALEMESSRPGDGEFVQSPLPVLAAEDSSDDESLPGEGDELLDKAIEVVRNEGRASTTLLQRHLRIGYARAARIIAALEEHGVVGPDQGGSRGREVLLERDV